MNLKELIEQMDECLFQLKEQAVYLYEMSQPQGKVRDNVRNLSSEIADHLIKAILYGREEHDTLHHWSHEINNWLKQCIKTKIKRKGKDTIPTKKELFTWLTDYYTEDDMEGIRRVWEHEYTYQGHASREHITDKEVYNSYISILKELCADVENITDDKVQEILEKYILA